MFRIYIVLAALAGFIAPAQAAIYYVATDGDGTNPSNGWATAATNIQTAINLATNSGDQVCVKQGTYNITNQLELTSTNSGVELLGGYVGSGTPGNRTNDPSLTVINAGSKCRVINCTGVSTGKVDGFTITRGSVNLGGAGIRLENSSITINNNLIINNSISWGTAYAVGVYCSGGSPTIINNRITGNRGIDCSGLGVYLSGCNASIINNLITANNNGSSGGGIRCVNSSSSVIQNNTIAGNSGGIVASGGSPTIKDCIIWNNGDDLANCTSTYSCVEDGDAGTGNISSDPLFVEGYFLSQTASGQSSNSPCVDSGSQSASAAGLDGRNTRSDGVNDTGTVDIGYHYSDASPAVTRYVSNSGNNAGAGTSGDPWKDITYALTNVAEGSTINVAAGTYNQASGETFPLLIGAKELILQGPDSGNCIIDAGSSARVLLITDAGCVTKINGFTLTGGLVGQGGAGIRVENSSPTISNNRIVSNRFNWGGARGAGIGCYGGVPTINNNRISDNWGPNDSYGAGIVVDDKGYVMIKNNLIIKNRVLSAGGIFVANGQATVLNNVIAGNTGGVFVASGFSANIKNCIIWNNGDDLNGCIATYSCIEDGDAGEGNIALDPKFTNPAGDDYHLKSGAGTWNGSGWTRYPGQNSPCIDAGDPASDYSNEPAPNGRRVNMGAYGNTREASRSLRQGTIFIIY